MTARILVVDDVATNRKLLEARLMAEYFQVLTASNGEDALKICAAGSCDMVLLDVMMPGMDGFEVCEKLKSNPETMHLPVVLVTALDQPEDRIKGLEAGADDFLTKPVNDLALITRVKSLVRLKMLTDDLRLRATDGNEMAIEHLKDSVDGGANSERNRIVVVDDRVSSYEKIVETLSVDNDVHVITNPNEALISIVDGDFGLAIISLDLEGMDSLRLCSYLRSVERTRSLPLIVVSESDQEQMISRALEIGVNDYIRRPIERNELVARVRTQFRRKHYNDCLRASVQQTIAMALKDPLTGMHNRRYYDKHYASLYSKAVETQRPLSVIMCDIDHFKRVNDTHGHAAGDDVIREVANRIFKSVRNIDLVCRYGGEEFVIVMPDTDTDFARVVAERIRAEAEAHPIVAEKGAKLIPVTISMGIATYTDSDIGAQNLVQKADEALYSAKRNGRNQVVTEAAA